MTQRHSRSVRHQRGFSLLELMVALMLSLVLLAGALSILLSSRITYSENDRIARLQEAGRTAVELILRDARPAGYVGCSRPVFGDEFANGLKLPTTLLWNFSEPVYGYDAAGTLWAPVLDALIPSAVTGSDVLVLRSTRQGQPVFRTTAAVVNVTDTLQVDRNAGATVASNTPMIISNCEGSATFMATTFTAGSATTATIAHITGGSTGNTSTSLARGGFGIGSLVMPVQSVIYYVRNSAEAAVGPTLWQKVGNGTARELVQGVENMQIQYGVDTDGDLLVNEYRTAATVGTDWSRVISVSVAVLIRSPEETGVERDNRTYRLLDQTVGPFNDRRQRSVFTTTVVLRNRTS